MRDRSGPLGVDVLVQRAAERDVHQLQAATDAEHRLAARLEGTQQALLVLVADAIARPAFLQRRLAVAARPDIGTALENQGIEALRIVVQADIALLRVADGVRDHQR